MGLWIKDICKIIHRDETVLSAYYNDDDTVTISITDGYGERTNSITLPFKKAKKFAQAIEDFIINLEEEQLK